MAKISHTAKRIIVIHDFLMSTVVQDVESFANAEAYVFHVASAFTTFSFEWDVKDRPCLDDVDSHLQLSKNPAIDDWDIMPAEFFEFIFPHFDCGMFSSGNLYNTCKVYDAKFLDLLSEEGFYGSKNQWALGPFNPVAVRNNGKLRERHKTLEWLDKQAQDSVIYVSFGTTISLPDEQIYELATGLNNSGYKFIWVLRDADKGDIFQGEVRRIELPKGFEERLEEKGLVVREWAPQLEILAHPATGGFMSHCGWNSCMESITMGVPIAAWPMHSDQPRNATLVTEVLKIGVSIRDWEHHGELVTSSTIKDTIQSLMSSNEIRNRAAKLGEDVRRSVEEGGVTRAEIDSFVSHVIR